MKNRTIIIDLSTCDQRAIAPILLGSAKGINAPTYWGSNAVFVALDPAIADHREYEAQVRESGLPVRLQH